MLPGALATGIAFSFALKRNMNTKDVSTSIPIDRNASVGRISEA
jgi:hypothetical protein